MSIKLSILDPSPIVSGHSAAEALNRTRELALAADEMDYRSFWVQEHHNTESFAGTAPEIMMADLASRTKRLQLGSGGIMLPNYSPLKVAEISTTLSALYPGRIEIGLGRATGADPRASAALLGPGADNFPQMLRMLLDWVLDASDEVPLPPDHRARGISSRPKAAKPDIWVLCSSPSSAAFIGAMGLKLAFADFLNPGLASAALSAYREASPVTFCTEALCSNRTDGADGKIKSTGRNTRQYNARLVSGQSARGRRSVPTGRASPAISLIKRLRPQYEQESSVRQMTSQTSYGNWQKIAVPTNCLSSALPKHYKPDNKLPPPERSLASG